MSTTAPSRDHVIRPGWITRNVLNRAMAWLSRRGVGVAGSRVLAVRGRKSGTWRVTPVNPMRHRGSTYLVAARGHVQWTYNMRAAGGGELRHGRRVRPFTATEVPDSEKPEILRAYLSKWKWEVGAFFQGLGPGSTDDELLAAAHRHPVFRIAYEGGGAEDGAG
ncbi:nitroreductase family deazaflavin-dependent oxidoreductase [Streptomyces boncukensis]|uniref:Nitroreductase family deazaflavin-dependent oxidoreductase n=1 Tax=Streptomyces boncukensis TaxID=2711219 RepID=A0A6G4X544_9ACTN|nr:nitroreductase family deazaflavin-dependent oxidoreductase [Streptomyces boncukensis]NGO71967.1 nitroreductase family deazaflavin-dependent oxidoreductase [Streptomyces boncukensis]